MPCCVKCPYLVKCCPKLPPFSISANNNFPRFSSIGAIIFSSDSPNASFSTYITAPANFHNPRCFNSQVYLGGPIPYNLARPLMVRQPYSAAVPSTGGRFSPSLLRFLSPANGGTEGGVKTIEGRFSKNISFSKYSFVSIILIFKNSDAKVNT